MSGRPMEDIAGRRFGRWTVLRPAPRKGSGGAASLWRWWCQCSCGSPERSVAATELKRGNSLSCGCLQKERARVTTLAKGRRRWGAGDDGPLGDDDCYDFATVRPKV